MKGTKHRRSRAGRVAVRRIEKYQAGKGKSKVNATRSLLPYAPFVRCVRSSVSKSALCLGMAENFKISKRAFAVLQAGIENELTGFIGAAQDNALFAHRPTVTEADVVFQTWKEKSPSARVLMDCPVDWKAHPTVFRRRKQRSAESCGPTHRQE